MYVSQAHLGVAALAELRSGLRDFAYVLPSSCTIAPHTRRAAPSESENARRRANTLVSSSGCSASCSRGCRPTLLRHSKMSIWGQQSRSRAGISWRAGTQEASITTTSAGRRMAGAKRKSSATVTRPLFTSLLTRLASSIRFPFKAAITTLPAARHAPAGTKHHAATRAIPALALFPCRSKAGAGSTSMRRTSM